MKKPSAKQQTQYDIIMLAARKMIYTDASAQTIVEKLQEFGQGPVMAIADTAANIVKAQRDILTKKGKKVSSGVYAGVLAAVVADLVSLAIAAGVVQESDKQSVAREALSAAGRLVKFRASETPDAQPQQPQQEPQGLVQNAMEA